VVNAFLAKAWVGVVVVQGSDIELLIVLMVSAFSFIGWVARHHTDEGGVGFAKRQGIAVHHDFHGVAKGRVFHEFDDSVRDESHVEEVLAALAFAFHRFDAGGSTDSKFIEGCHFVLVFSTCKNTAFSALLASLFIRFMQEFYHHL
jgi:hypothetical protein